VDATGNRRWWVVVCNATADDRGEDLASLIRDRDQVWAEAVAAWRLGEDLTLPKELENDALRLQEQAQADDSWRGMIAEWLDRKIPKDWAQKDLPSRLSWWSNDFAQEPDDKLVPRETVCVAEIWCELMRKDKGDMDLYKSRRIGNILRASGEWVPVGPRPSIAYGMQKMFRKKDA
jgi:hypothetical protein